MIVTHEGKRLAAMERAVGIDECGQRDEEVNNLHDERDNPLIAVGVLLIATLLCASKLDLTGSTCTHRVEYASSRFKEHETSSKGAKDSRLQTLLEISH